MTTQQSGREAFEVWPRGVLNRETTIKVLTEHNAWRRGAIGPQTDPILLGKALDAALAALAQQGREVGEAVAWHPVIAELHEHMRHCVSAADEGVDYAVSREMLDAMTTMRLMEKCGRGKWRPTEYGESFANTAAPKQKAVDEAMVERLRDHLVELRCYYVEARDGVRGYSARETQYTRLIDEVDADLAALPVKTEVDRG